jgi:hypothetical protein
VARGGAGGSVLAVFRRRDMGAPVAPPQVGVATAVLVADGAAWPHEDRAAAWRALRRIAAEAVILQDDADELLLEIRDRCGLAEVARPCGRLMGRFLALREALPACPDTTIQRHCAAMRSILDHHVLLLNGARAMLAAEGRSERLSAQLDRIEGLGAPAARMEAVRRELLATAP